MRKQLRILPILVAFLIGSFSLWSEETQSDTVMINTAQMYGVFSQDRALLKQVGSMVLFRVVNNEPLSSMPKWVQELKDTKPEWVDHLKDQGWPEGKTYDTLEMVPINMARMYGIRSNNPTLLLVIGGMILFRTQYKIPLSTLPIWVNELME